MTLDKRFVTFKYKCKCVGIRMKAAVSVNFSMFWNILVFLFVDFSR